MVRRRRPLLLVAIIAATVLAVSAALAERGLTVRISRPPSGLRVGQAWTATVRLERNRRPVARARPAVVIRGATTRAFRARRAGAAGVYRARVIFPSAGRWAYFVRLGGRLHRRGTALVGPRVTPPPTDARFREYPVPSGTHPHDVAPAPDGSVWYTAQFRGSMGRLDPETGRIREIPLGAGSAPHGVIVGPDRAAWVTDPGLNAIVRVDHETEGIRAFPLLAQAANADLNTATFDRQGRLWFTGKHGWYGRLDPRSGAVTVWPAPRGEGPYGIVTAPDGVVYYASLEGSYVGRIDVDTGEVRVLEPPTPGQGARRVWPDSRSRIWVAEWNAGNLAMYDPAANRWQEWRLPGASPQPYAVFVDDRDIVWLTDFGADALVRFDPATERFATFPWPTSQALVRQLLGRPGEIWGAESARDKIVVFRNAD